MGASVGLDVETCSCNMHKCTCKATIGGSTYKNLSVRFCWATIFLPKEMPYRRGFQVEKYFLMFSINKENPLCK